MGSNELSTNDIEEKIKQINAAEVIGKEEQLLENIAAEEVEEEIDELTDIAAAEIVAEEIAEERDELTDIEAAEIVGQEIANELVEEMSLLEISSIKVSDEQKENSEDSDSTEEGSGNISIDFVDNTEVVL